MSISETVVARFSRSKRTHITFIVSSVKSPRKIVLESGSSLGFKRDPTFQSEWGGRTAASFPRSTSSEQDFGNRFLPLYEPRTVSTIINERRSIDEEPTASVGLVYIIVHLELVSKETAPVLSTPQRFVNTVVHGCLKQDLLSSLCLSVLRFGTAP